MNNWLFENIEFVNYMVIFVGVVLFSVVLALDPSSPVALKDKKVDVIKFIVAVVLFAGWVIASFGVRDSLDKMAVKINDEYKVRVNFGMGTFADKSLILYKLNHYINMDSEDLVKTDIGNGMTIKKYEPSTKEMIKEVAKAKIVCNNLNYDECIQKVKENIDTIASKLGPEGSIAVVEF